MSNLPFAIYLHSPFCKHKCGYCDFNSWAETRVQPQEQWLEGLDKSSKYWSGHLYEKELFRPVKAKSLFWGGGTPSLLAEHVTVKALQIIHRDWKFTDNAEKTIEVNPETLTDEKLKLWFDCGLTRLSMGVQSFSESNLDLLERSARPKDNILALEKIVKQWKGQSWSLDLIFGLPNQSLEDWEQDLRLAMIFSPPHISAYQLTLTTARSRKWNQPSDEVLEKMFDFTKMFLEANGYHRYEVSNFAKIGHESAHNKNYWELGSFIGLGPGAAGLLGRDIELRNLKPPLIEDRYFKEPQNYFGFHQKNPDAFEKWYTESGSESFELKNLSLRDLESEWQERLMMGLRLNGGIPRWKLPVSHSVIEEMLQQPWAKGNFDLSDPEKLAVNEKGLKILDTLLPKMFNTCV
jgi:putative oxygen-independent coproporphyrinogen III oxidase